MVNGITKRATATGFIYQFPLAIITIDTATDGMEIATRGDSDSVYLQFSQIADKLGASDIEGYADALAYAGEYSVTTARAATSAYGELLATDSTPIAVGNGVYNFVPSNFRTFIAGTGTAGVSSNRFVVFSGTALGNYGAVRSFRSLNYKTGQGATIRASARFNNALASTWSGVGGLNIGDEVSFGYNGTAFGTWHRYGGRAEVQYLQITTPAGGNQTATVTINSVVYSIPITSGTAEFNARQITDYLTSNAQELVLDQVGDTVRMMFTSDGDKTGTFSWASSGAAVGEFTQITQGVSKTSNHTPMTSWNVSPNGFTGFDPSKGNSYEIKYQNGFGNIRYFIEDPTTGSYKLVHIVQWANANTALNMANPSLRVGAYATALGTIAGVTVECAYIAGFVTGSQNKTRNPRGYSNTKSISTTVTNLFTVKTANIYNGLANQGEIEPVFLNLANDGAKTAIFELRNNATVAGSPNFTTIGTKLLSSVDVDGTTVTADGTLLASYVVAKGSGVVIDLSALETRLPPSVKLTISGAMVSGAAADLSASLTWYEDI